MAAEDGGVAEAEAEAEAAGAAREVALSSAVACCRLLYERSLDGFLYDKCLNRQMGGKPPAGVGMPCECNQKSGFHFASFVCLLLQGVLGAPAQEMACNTSLETKAI